jgi:uncharacterized cupin superfamily protein
MPNANVFTTRFTFDPADPQGYRAGVVHITRLLGATDNAVKSFEIPPGESICPYHYEYEEEWLLVLDGELIVREPGGERPAVRGDLFVFPAGPDGAHKVTNHTQETALALMWSSAREPSVAVYPDSDKIGVWPGNEADKLMLRRADGQVDYYDGEV